MRLCARLQTDGGAACEGQSYGTIAAIPGQKTEVAMTIQKTALILGVTGGIGGQLSDALLAHGWKVVAMVRDPAKAAGQCDPRIRLIAGDAMDAADTLKAAQGVQVIAHCVNPPGYKDWDRLVFPMIDNSIAAARAVGARILLP